MLNNSCVSANTFKHNHTKSINNRIYFVHQVVSYHKYYYEYDILMKMNMIVVKVVMMTTVVVMMVMMVMICQVCMEYVFVCIHFIHTYSTLISSFYHSNACHFKTMSLLHLQGKDSV